MLYRFTLAALLAGCAAGGVNSTPTALAPNGHQAMTPDTNWDSAPDASGCFRRNRFVREDRLRRGGPWTLHVGSMRADYAYVSVVARNALRNVTINLWPTNDPDNVKKIAPGATIEVKINPPSSGVVIQEATPMRDRGPGARVNGRVCQI
jgi:hypothetical protein